MAKSLMIASILLLSACGGSALQTHATAAEAVRTLNDTAVEVVETTCEERALREARNPEVHVDVARANASGLIEDCQRIAHVQHLVADAHGLWVAYLLRTVANDDFNAEVAFGYALRVLQLYKDVVAMAADFDLSLPDPPDVLLRLMGE